MTLYHAITTTSDKARAEALSEAMERLDPVPSAVGIHDRDDGSGIWEIGAYFEGRPDDTALALLAAAHEADGFSVAPVGTQDWMAQVRAGLTPVEAGRFVVYGSHDRDAVPSHKIGLEIEAALAFGTGHHATTQGCLLALDTLARQGLWPRNIADIGGGTGILSMAAARVFACPIIASDIDALATATACENIRANNLTGRIACITAPGFNHPRLRGGGPYDLILSNILAGPLKRMAGDMARHSLPGGILVLSGIMTRQAAGVEAVYRGHGFARRDLLRRDEWTVLILQRPG